MTKPVTLGFVYGAATPIALAIATAMFFTGGNLIAIPLAAVSAAPIAIGVTVIFGVPLYFAYQRLGITSLVAYSATGFALAVLVVAIALWDEYIGGYMNAREALLDHTMDIVSLISGPAAAAVFWSIVRPDMPDVYDSGSSARRVIGFVALGIVFLAWVASSVYSMMNAPRVRSIAPLKTECFSFDSTKAADLIASLKAYASSHSSHFGYYFMPTHMPQHLKAAHAMPPLLVVATLRFPNEIQIEVTNAGNKGLCATIYSARNGADDRLNQIWSDFLSFLPPAVEHANTLPLADLPKIHWRGEGGVLETHWWDWRFYRQ